jgi:hypothetical protein
MSYTVRSDNILTWTLLKKLEGVSIYDVKRLSEEAQAKVSNCDFDVEAKSLWAVVEDSAVFEWYDDYTIVFTKEYIDRTDELKKSLEYTMPKCIYEALENSHIDNKLN